MVIVAKSVVGHEYLYNASSAHGVSKRSANIIVKILNDCKWHLKPNEVWFIHEVDMYDNAYDYAQRQKFTIRKGIVNRVGY